MSILLAPGAIAAGTPQWTWEAGKQTNNGSITVKSVSGGATYSGTQNPTGAVARTNQNAFTQPPTVILQATGSSGGCLGQTRTTYNGGSLGGLSGADAKCVAEFGTGWRFASQLDIAGCMGGVVPEFGGNGPWFHQPGQNNCGNWNDNGNTGGSLSKTIGGLGSTGGGIPVLDRSEGSCGTNRSLACVKLQ